MIQIFQTKFTTVSDAVYLIKETHSHLYFAIANKLHSPWPIANKLMVYSIV